MKLSPFAQDFARSEMIKAARLIHPHVEDVILDGSGQVRGWIIEDPASDGWIISHVDQDQALWFAYFTEAKEWIRANG